LQTKSKGLFEKQKGTGIWWIRYTDWTGVRHSEKVGRHSDAEDLYAKRRHEALLRKKLPESFRNHRITFEQLVNDALEHSKEQNGTQTNVNLEGKLNVLSAIFGKMAASDITKQDIQRWLQEQTEKRNWKAGTRNRWQAAFSLVFRVGVDNDKIETNPASRIKRKTENNGRVRFLSDEEETKIRKVLEAKYPQYIPAFDISLHTGMRASEQFGLHWNQIDLERKLLSLPKTKNGSSRVASFELRGFGCFPTITDG
jgi:integrase